MLRPTWPSSDVYDIFTRKGKQILTHARNSKINEEKQNIKHKWKRVQEKAKNQRSRFLHEYESKNIIHT
jgi:hypothetical protein